MRLRKRARRGRDASFARAAMVAVHLAFGAVACSDGPSSPDLGEEPVTFGNCQVNKNFLVAGTTIDGIPSVDEPRWVRAEDGDPAYLVAESRVIGLILNQQAYAIPHSVLWFHEVVNMGAGALAVAVSYCPLTGSSLAFWRAGMRGPFGVSGLLFMNNLVMFDREDPDSRWSQMRSDAICGPDAGQTLDQWPIVEMTWAAWKALHPTTMVLDGDQGFDYINGLFDTDSPYDSQNYPYGAYEIAGDFWIPTAMPAIDGRRPPKERTIGVPSGEEGSAIAFPFGELMGLPGSLQAIEFEFESSPAVLLWSDEAQGGMAYWPRTETGDRVWLIPSGEAFADEATGSAWTVMGEAVSGPLAGERLVPLERAFVSFWGAWAAFFPDARLWDS